jgi:hypothetical protein
MEGGLDQISMVFGLVLDAALRKLNGVTKGTGGFVFGEESKMARILSAVRGEFMSLKLFQDASNGLAPAELG